MSVKALIKLYVFLPLAFLANAGFAYKTLPNSIACAPGQTLEIHETAAFAQASRTYIATYVVEGHAYRFEIDVDVPGAFVGDGFPEDVCGGEVVITLEGRAPRRAVLNYERPDLSQEHPDWPFRATFKDDEKAQFVFYQASDVIWGYITLDGIDTFFTAADQHRW